MFLYISPSESLPVHSGIYSLPVSNLDARWGCVINAKTWSLYRRRKALVPIVQEVGWTPGSVWTSMEKRQYFVDTGVRTYNLPASSKSVHWPRYSVPLCLLLGSLYYLVAISYIGANTRLFHACSAHKTCAAMLSYERWDWLYDWKYATYGMKLLTKNDNLICPYLHIMEHTAIITFCLSTVFSITDLRKIKIGSISLELFYFVLTRWTY
jgi:hypothetical protein